MPQSKPSTPSNLAFKIDATAVRSLAVILAETDLNEIEYESDAGRIRVARHAPQMVQHAAPMGAPTVAVMTSPAPTQASLPSEALAVSESDWSKHPGAIISPMVGTAYLSGQPTMPPFIKEGDTVTEGQTLLIIEAMKVMNPLKSAKAGKVIKILVQDGSPVEYGEPLCVIA